MQVMQSASGGIALWGVHVYTFPNSKEHWTGILHAVRNVNKGGSLAVSGISP